MVARRPLGLLFLLAVVGIVTTPSPASAGAACPAVPASAPAGVTVGSAAPPALVGSAAARLQAVVNPDGQQLAWFFEYGPTDAYGSCTATVALAGSEASPVATVVTGLAASTTYHFRLVALAADGASAIATADESFTTLSPGEIAQGVTLGGVGLGGLDSASAAPALRRLLATPVHLQLARRHWSTPRSDLGAQLNVAAAVALALQAAPGQALRAAIKVDRARLARYLRSANGRYGLQRPAILRLAGGRAIVRPARSGIAIYIRPATRLTVHYLKANLATPLRLPSRRAAPPKTGPNAKAVVVRLDAQTLTAYLNGKPVLHAPVTTGRPALPTPIGSYHIEAAYSPFTFHSPWPPGSPYWYPPTPVTWAMPFYGGDFLHNDPGEPASAFGRGSEDGPYASHGCVHVPNAAMGFLFHWLPIGATVIVART